MNQYWVDFKIVLISIVGYSGLCLEQIITIINPDFIKSIDQLTEVLTHFGGLLIAILTIIYLFYRAKIECIKYKNLKNGGE